MHTIKVSDIEIEIERKSIKNMHLAVYPPDARVRISMPDYLSEESTFNWQVKQMKTEWGSCVPSKRMVIFNLELARVPRECNEFMIVHEFCHLRIDNHNKLF